MGLDRLYIASMTPGAGKLVVTMGLMELLTRRIGKIAFFRPIIDPPGGGRDPHIELIRSRYTPSLSYDDCFAFTADEVKAQDAEGRFGEVISGIIERVKKLEERFDFILFEGLNSYGFLAAFDMSVNIEIAKNIGAPFISVMNGQDLLVSEVEEAVSIANSAVDEAGCLHFALFINRLAPEVHGHLVNAPKPYSGPEDLPVFYLPEVDELDHPTVGEIADHTGASLVIGREEDLSKVVSQCKIAAMTVEHFLDYVEEGDLIIAAGDRSDIILASISSLFSPRYPNIAGILLTGGFVPGPNVMGLFEGRSIPVPIISLESDTYTASRSVDEVPAVIAPGDERKAALVLGIFEENVDTDILIERATLGRPSVMTPAMFQFTLFERARDQHSHIVLPESEDERILRAAELLLRRGIVDITLLGDPARVEADTAALGIDLSAARVVDPAVSAWRDEFAHELASLRGHKGVTLDSAREILLDSTYFATMMVHLGKADGMVSGAAHTTADTIRPALQIIKTRPGYSIVSSVFFMCMDTRVLVYGDCAINPDPTSEQLADIALASAETALLFGIEPRVAMLSYSTGSSGGGKDVEKVRHATDLVRERMPGLAVEGPIQYDAAIDPEVARVKMPGSDVAGMATVFIFPDLNTGNNTYKAVQRATGAIAIGPILQGLKRPVNDLSRGCTVADVINTVAITAIQSRPLRGLLPGHL